jgi:hypothetical protein
MRIIKLVKIFKIGKIIRSMEELITKDEIMLIWTLLQFLGRVLVVAHWFACFYWLIAEYEMYNSQSDKSSNEDR